MIFTKSSSLKKYLKLSASFVIFPIIAICGFILLSGLWFIFFWKTSPKPPLTKKLNFLLNDERSYLHSDSFSFNFSSEINFIEIEFALRVPESLNSSLPNHPFSLVLKSNEPNEKILLNFFPTYRSPTIRLIRSFLRIPLYLTVGRLEEETITVRTKAKIQSKEFRANVLIKPPLPLYDSQIKIYSIQTGIARIIHSWKVLSLIVFILFNLIINLLVGIIGAYLLFHFSIRNNSIEEDISEEINIETLFKEKKVQ
jgi:hypothetical protein